MHQTKRLGYGVNNILNLLTGPHTHTQKKEKTQEKKIQVH